MKSIIPFSISSNNKIKYLYSLKSKNYTIVNPYIYELYILDKKGKLYDDNNILRENDYEIEEAEKEFYLKKYLFLKSNGFFDDIKIDLGDKITKLQIEKSLLNLNNLVFEVTDACNLNCKYCGYGEIYYDHDERKNKFLDIKMVKGVLKFLKPYLSQSDEILFIGFYGGEPLLNIDLIKEAIFHIKSILPQRKVCFTMTTNGILLEKNIKFLIDYDFKLLISIDGNKYNHSYRVLQSGKNSFDLLFNTLKKIKKQYPEYFIKNINFNTVLHNRNSIIESHDFLYKEFEKITRFSPLDNSGISSDKKDEFKNMYQDVYHEWEKIDNKEKIIQERFIDDPNVFRLAMFLKSRINNTQFDYYDDLFTSYENYRLPSGTCLPFQKKFFVTVNGKILACERINQDFFLGNIRNGKVKLDFDYIEKKYNSYYKNIIKKCLNCYKVHACLQCIFQIDNFTEHYDCSGFSDIRKFSSDLSEIVSFIEQNPKLLNKIINEVVIK